MVLLIFIFGVLLALGLFFIMADLLKLPRLATQRAMLSVGRQERSRPAVWRPCSWGGRSSWLRISTWMSTSGGG